MKIMHIIHRIALLAETCLDRLWRRKSTQRVLDAYIGYATQKHLVIRGRVLVAHRGRTARENSSRLSNFRDMISLFLTDEVADVTVRCGDLTAVSDEEGYFTLLLPRPATPGWIDVPVSIEGTENAVPFAAFVPSQSARHMVITDIDDTVMKTGAYSLTKNLWTSLTGNALTRKIYPDAVQLIADLSDDNLNPVFYVSSSPWNLHGFLSDIFARNGLTRGPMFLRDLGLSDTKFITDGHGDHKGNSIDMLIRAHPELPTILIGDTGQKDATIYAAIVEMHPGRVAAVILRETDNGSDQDDFSPIERITQAGVPVFHSHDFPTVDALRLKIAKKL